MTRPAPAPWAQEVPTVRLMQQAAELLTDAEVEAIVGPGGLSGASHEQAQQLIYAARGAAAAEFLQGA